MLTKRIIPCLDVKNEKVVKGVKFKNHEIVGSIETLAQKYSNEGADELVFYDIGASTINKTVSKKWVKKIAKLINIPFCVAGGIKNVNDARNILNNGADKISINTPAIENPLLITELANEFGAQCVVIGIDSLKINDDYYVFSKTGDQKTITNTKLKTTDWLKKVQKLGAGEIVLNCMDKDGVRDGYDIEQLNILSENARVPIIASGGAGNYDHFRDVLKKTNVSGALAASVFHKNVMTVTNLKRYLNDKYINVRL